MSSMSPMVIFDRENGKVGLLFLKNYYDRLFTNNTVELVTGMELIDERSDICFKRDDVCLIDSSLAAGRPARRFRLYTFAADN